MIENSNKSLRDALHPQHGQDILIMRWAIAITTTAMCGCATTPLATTNDEHNCHGYPSEGRVLRRIGYTAGHGRGLRIPLWVSYRLAPEYADGREFVPRKKIPWRADTDLPSGERATDDDYRHSGYSRGHMAMQSDLRGRSEKCERQGKLLSNAAPQRQGLNGGVWLRLENRCKGWARTYGEVWIICGPIFYGEPDRLDGVSGGRVAIPDGFYKIAVREAPDGPFVIAFTVQHEPWAAKDTPLSEFIVSVDEIEAETGLDFLADLDDTRERLVESTVPAIWP